MSSASWVSSAARARWTSASALSVSVVARSARIRASSRDSRLSSPPNCGLLKRSSNILKRFDSKPCANRAFASACSATSIALRAASRLASAAWIAASRADSCAFAAAVSSATSSRAATSRSARKPRWASSLAASSGSLSSISTTGSFIFTRLPSTTCQRRICPETRAVITCMRSTGAYAMTMPWPCTVCCQGTSARRNGAARKARKSRRARMRTVRGVAAPASADRRGSESLLTFVIRLMSTPRRGRNVARCRRGP